MIAGMSGRLPESDNLQEFWDNLIGGVDMVTEDERRWKAGEWAGGQPQHLSLQSPAGHRWPAYPGAGGRPAPGKLV